MDEDLIVTAGEYVLGTLEGEELDRFVLRLATDRAAADAVAEWRARFALLLFHAPGAMPPAGVWQGISAHLDRPASAANDNLVSRGWRSTAIAASMAAILLAAFALRPQTSAPVAPAPIQVAEAPRAAYVAAVAAEEAQPALLITFDPRSGKAVIRALSLTPPALKSLELWYIGAGKAPRSLGILQRNGRSERRVDPAFFRGDRLEASTFAVSVEPRGGAPAGVPTGQILYTGKVLALNGTS